MSAEARMASLGADGLPLSRGYGAARSEGQCRVHRRCTWDGRIRMGCRVGGDQFPARGVGLNSNVTIEGVEGGLDDRFRWLRRLKD